MLEMDENISQKKKIINLKARNLEQTVSYIYIKNLSTID